MFQEMMISQGGGTSNYDTSPLYSVSGNTKKSFPTKGKAIGFTIVVDYNPNIDIFTNVNPSTGEVTNSVYYARSQNGGIINDWAPISWVYFDITDNSVTPSVALISSNSIQFISYMY